MQGVKKEDATMDEEAREARRLETQERIVRQIGRLPPMPETAMKLRALANDPHVDFPQIVPHVEKDPGLCADLLRYANSAAAGVGHPVETVAEAVRYYGMDNLLHYIWVFYSNRLAREAFKPLKHLDDYFLHAEQVSTACAILARRANLVVHDQEVCKVAGLLHNIGKLVVLLATKRWGDPLEGTPWGRWQKEIAEEESEYGLNHCEVGAKLCEKWNFPDKLLKAIRYHHRPILEGKLIPLAAYVYLGEVLAIEDLPVEAVAADFRPEDMKALGLDGEDLRLAREEYLAVRPDGSEAAGR